MGIEDYSQIASGLAAIAAIIISIGFYRHGLNRERKMDTLKTLSEIRMTFFNTKMLSKEEKLTYLNRLEFFSTGVNEKIYDIKIVKKMSGSRLIKQYDNWACGFIKDRIIKCGNDNSYNEYKTMIENLEKLSGHKQCKQ